MLIQTFVELPDSSLFLVVSDKLVAVVDVVDRFVSVGGVGAAGDVGGELTRQTRLAEMHEPPHGIPFLQVRCA